MKHVEEEMLGQRLRATENPFAFDKAAAWEKLNNALSQQQKQKRQRTILWAIAASVAALLCVGMLFPSKECKQEITSAKPTFPKPEITPRKLLADSSPQVSFTGVDVQISTKSNSNIRRKKRPFSTAGYSFQNDVKDPNAVPLGTVTPQPVPYALHAGTAAEQPGYFTN